MGGEWYSNFMNEKLKETPLWRHLDQKTVEELEKEINDMEKDPQRTDQMNEMIKIAREVLKSKQP